MIRLKYCEHQSDCYVEMDCGLTGGTQRRCGETSEEALIAFSAGGEGELGKKGAGRLDLGTVPFLGSPLVLSAMLAALPQSLGGCSPGLYGLGLHSAPLTSSFWPVAICMLVTPTLQLTFLC